MPSRWPSGFASAGLPAAGLGDGLADAFTINALLALATAALAYFTLGRARAEGSSSPDTRTTDLQSARLP